MQRTFVNKNAYNTGKSTANQELVYQHMSNHYRRILNAKKVVDTSPPRCYKHLRPLSGRTEQTLQSARSQKAKFSLLGKNTSPVTTDRSISTNSYSANTGPYPSSRYHVGCIEDLASAHLNKKYVVDKRRADGIAFNKKNASSCCFSEDNWTNAKGTQNEIKCKLPANIQKCRCNVGSIRTSKRRFQSTENESAQKKVHADRLENKDSPEFLMECTLEVPDCKCRKICVCDANADNDAGSNTKKIAIRQVKDQIQTSSRDSAYNGGVSSLPESRSPTPDGRTKDRAWSNKNEAFFCGNDKLKSQKSAEKIELNAATSDSGCQREKYLDLQMSNGPETYLLTPQTKHEEVLRKIKEDDLYTKFIEDITVEILEKCLYTNKALKKVMKKHILNNLQTLDKNRMLKEVDNLRVRLDIPEDCNLFDLDVTATNSYGDIVNAHSVISDSEFVMPEINECQKGKVTELQGLKERKIAETLTPANRDLLKVKKSLSRSESDKEEEEEEEPISIVSTSTNKKLEEYQKTNSPRKKSFVSQECDKYLSDESDVSSYGSNKNKSDVQERQLDHVQESSFEIEEDISEEISLETPGAEENHALTKCTEITETSVSSMVHKKIRSVSFRNNGNSTQVTSRTKTGFENKIKNGI